MWAHDGRRLVRAAAILPVFGSVLVGGCAAARSNTEVRLEQPVPPRPEFAQFDRVLVAGFSTVETRGFDVNAETVRVLQAALSRSMAFEILRSQPRSLPNASLEPQRRDDAMFTDAVFWRRLGEEYGKPLIVTGVVSFLPVAPRLEERSVGRRVIRVWRPGFRLRLHVVLISGETGQVLKSVNVGSLTAHATDVRRGALPLYYDLMGRAMPHILGTFGNQRTRNRVLLR